MALGTRPSEVGRRRRHQQMRGPGCARDEGILCRGDGVVGAGGGPLRLPHSRGRRARRLHGSAAAVALQRDGEALGLAEVGRHVDVVLSISGRTREEDGGTVVCQRVVRVNGEAFVGAAPWSHWNCVVGGSTWCVNMLLGPFLVMASRTCHNAAKPLGVGDAALTVDAEGGRIVCAVQADLPIGKLTRGTGEVTFGGDCKFAAIGTSNVASGGFMSAAGQETRHRKNETG